MKNSARIALLCVVVVIIAVVTGFILSNVSTITKRTAENILSNRIETYDAILDEIP